MKQFDWEYRNGVYYIYDRRQGSQQREAIASCGKAYDAERIVDALNKAVSDG